MKILRVLILLLKEKENGRKAKVSESISERRMEKQHSNAIETIIPASFAKKKKKRTQNERFYKV